jgi:flagellar hook protein FlgE
MGLQTTMTTSLTGMTAAETTIDVVGNNVANANTVGFKESSVSFATQFLQTQSIGSGPTDSRGGTNPRQVGLGVKVAEISPDFTQGTIEISSNPLDLAIQGDGFFIVQGGQGEQFYTRNGQFKTNANNEIVTITGHRVLGYSVDANFNIQPTGLTPLQIPLGAAAVAQATENVSMEGNLNPNDDVGTIPEQIASIILSDGSRAFPTALTDYGALARPNVDLTTSTLGAGVATIPAGTYRYKFAFVDVDGNEGPASAATDPLVVPAGGVDEIDLANIPAPVDADFTQVRIYRNEAGAGTTYELVGTIASGVTVFTDNAAAGGAALVEGSLSNNSYSYYITYASAANPTDESRPSAQFGPITADATNAPYIRLEGLPVPPVGSGYDRIRIYRNVSTDPSSFFLVDEIDPSTISSYIDLSTDATIAANPLIDLEGPPIAPSLKLVDVVTRDGANYINLFQEGELSFTGSKDGRELAERTLTIDANTDVQALIAFMEQSMGVVKTATESTFPSVSGGYGGSITSDSRLQFTSNMGIENALSIDLSAFRLTPTATGIAETVPLEFTSTQEANGEGSTAEVIVYDSLGSPVSVRITTVLEQVDSTGARFRWIATSPDHQPDSGFSTVVGTGVITTDGSGKFVSASDNRVAIDRGNSPAVSPLAFDLDFSQITGLDDETEWAAGVQDGLAAGTLTSFIITESGLIQGVFSNGSSRDLGQIRMARFANNGGLEQLGDNLFAAGVNSGLPIQGDPGSQGIGNITAGAVELSNTDIGQNLIKLILASTQYRGGARVITAAQELLDELLALRR